MLRRCRTLASTLLFLTSALPLAAGEPYLVKDIYPGLDEPNGSYPHLYGSAGSRLVFLAHTYELGWMPWGSDGTSAGTEPLLDPCPVACESGLRVYGQTGRLAFFHLRGDGDHEGLWSTDGTRAGTFRVAGPSVLPQVSPGLVDTPSQVYFLADDSVHGTELWRSDGTPAGTHLAADLRPGSEGAAIAELTALGERALFVADDGRGPSLWTSDGTAAGTRLLLDPNPRSATQERPAHLRRAGRYVYFTANAGAGGTELWRSDGTPAGTARVSDLVPGPRSLRYVAGGTLGDRLLFVAATPDRGEEVWVSNGTRGGTYPLSRFARADPFARIATSDPDRLPHVDLGGRALFLADDGAHGAEVWVTDGGREGARLLRDLCPGPCSSAPTLQSARLGNLGFFTATDGTHGSELWATDGSDAGTRMVADLCAGPCGSVVPFVGAVGHQIAFLSLSGSTQVWSWSPTAPAAQRGFFEPTETERLPFVARAVGRRLFLGVGSQGGVGKELWRTNLAPGGNVLVRDIDPSGFGYDSFPYGFMKLGDRSLFFATGPRQERGLWRSDGTEGGTELVMPLPRPLAKSTLQWAELGSSVVFGLTDENRFQRALWRSDGTAPGTFSLGPGVSLGETPAVAGGNAFFTSANSDGAGGGSGVELWATDGTLAGTRQVDDLEPGSRSSNPEDLTALGNRVVFHATTELDGDELWVSDGTANGTRLVKDLTPTIGESTNPTSFVRHGSKIYFGTFGALDRRLVWRTDGSAAGTGLAIDGSALSDASQLTPLASNGTQLFLYAGGALYASDGESGALRELVTLGSGAGFPTACSIVGGRLYFYLNSNSSGQAKRLWTSDGTVAGTVPVEIVPGVHFDFIRYLQVVGGRLYFLNQPGNSPELWTTDGTPGGLRPLLHGGVPASSGLGEAGGKILFTWNWINSGFELWALEP